MSEYLRHLVRRHVSCGPIVDTALGIRIFLDVDDSSLNRPSVDVFMIPIELRPTQVQIDQLHAYLRGIPAKKLGKLSRLKGMDVFERRRSLTVGADYVYSGLKNTVDIEAENQMPWLSQFRSHFWPLIGYELQGQTGGLINDYASPGPNGEGGDYISQHSDDESGLSPGTPIFCYTDYSYDTPQTPRATTESNHRFMTFSRIGERAESNILVLATVPGMVYVMNHCQRGYTHGSPLPGKTHRSVSPPCAAGINRISITERDFLVSGGATKKLKVRGHAAPLYLSTPL